MNWVFTIIDYPQYGQDTPILKLTGLVVKEGAVARKPYHNNQSSPEGHHFR